METSIAQEIERAPCASAELRIRKTQVHDVDRLVEQSSSFPTIKIEIVKSSGAEGK